MIHKAHVYKSRSPSPSASPHSALQKPVGKLPVAAVHPPAPLLIHSSLAPLLPANTRGKYACIGAQHETRAPYHAALPRTDEQIHVAISVHVMPGRGSRGSTPASRPCTCRSEAPRPVVDPQFIRVESVACEHARLPTTDMSTSARACRVSHGYLPLGVGRLLEPPRNGLTGHVTKGVR